MVSLTRLNGKNFVLNTDMIEYMESTPDTVITLTNGHKYVVLETLDEVIDKVIHYKRHMYMGTDFEDR